MPKWWRGREGKGAVLSRGEHHFTDQSPVVVVPCKHSVNSILALVLEPIVTNHNPGNSQFSLKIDLLPLFYTLGGVYAGSQQYYENLEVA